MIELPCHSALSPYLKRIEFAIDSNVVVCRGATELIEQNGGRKSVKGRDTNRMVKLDRESDFETKFFTIIMIQVIKWSFGRKGDKLERKHSPLAMASPFAFGLGRGRPD